MTLTQDELYKRNNDYIAKNFKADEWKATSIENTLMDVSL